MAKVPSENARLRVMRQQCRWVGGVDHAAAREQAQHAGAHRRQELGDMEGSELRELDEAWRSVGLFSEDAIERYHVEVWIESQVRRNTLHDGDGSTVQLRAAVGLAVTSRSAATRARKATRDRSART